MTATDELRRLLDGRGVEHRDATPDILHDATNWVTKAWLADGRWFRAIETQKGDFTLELFGLTPAQAVEATLGSDLEAENAELRELVRDYEELAAALCDARECDGCPFDSERAICEHMRLVARVGELGVEV